MVEQWTIPNKWVMQVKALIEEWQKHLDGEDLILRAHAEGTVAGLETALMTLGLLRYQDSIQAKRLGRAATVDGVENLGERNWLAPEGDADGQ